MKLESVAPTFIFVTGGVCSGLGKGIASASIGALLNGCSFNVVPLKCDPYLNVDPGTMNPSQHGEVFVTDDGAETDLDLGHYERFMDLSLSRLNSVTAGQIYREVIQRERKGDFLGRTIQIVPHITDAIKNRMRDVSKAYNADILIVEIGGTVGDIEGEPFLEAARQIHHEYGSENVLFVHLVLLPYLTASKELKTKPAQASVRSLRERGISPDVIIARADYMIPQELIAKISLFCDVQERAVIPAPTIHSIYQVPLHFEQAGLSKVICSKLALAEGVSVSVDSWKKLSDSIAASTHVLTIGIVGKYLGMEDTYYSVIEALKIAGFYEHIKVNIKWIDPEELLKNDSPLYEVDGIVVPGGFGGRGIEGKIVAAQYARVHNTPYLGLCLGAHVMVIEFARNVMGWNDAHTQEVNADTKYPVVHLMDDQKKFLEKGGTMRLGAYECDLVRGTKTAQLYGVEKVSERHRHRYEFNTTYASDFAQKGLIVSGTSAGAALVEMVELQDHPFMIGTQSHPEFLSRPLTPHPLFVGFIQTCKNIS